MSSEPAVVRRVRFLVVTDELHRAGGAPMIQLAVARELVARGHRCDVRYLHDGPRRASWATFAEGVVWARQIGERPIRGSRGAALRLAGVASFNRAVNEVAGRRARRRGVGVVVCNGHAEIQSASELARAARVPLVVHLQGPPWSLDRLGRRRRRAFLSASRFIAVSAAAREAWIEHGLPADRCEVVRNGVDIARFRPPSAEDRHLAREGLGLDSDAQIILFVGRVAPGKGVEDLLAAVALLGDIDAQLLVVGFPRDADEYSTNLRSRVLAEGFRGFSAVDDPTPFYWAADVVAVPSATFDAFPTTSLEALACGLPVVTTDVGGCSEMLPPGWDRFVACPGDPASLASALARVLHTPGEELSVAARDVAVSRWSQQRMMDEFESVLVHVAAAGS